MHDDDFARTLRERADALVPPLQVTTDRVIPRARRRRAVVRSAGTVAASTVLLGAAWAAAGVTGPPTTLAPPATTVVLPAPTPSPTEKHAPAPDVVAAPAEDDVTDRWWYTHTQVLVDGAVTEERRTWESREHPGLVVPGEGVENAFAMGPVSVLGRFFLDGEWVDQLRDPGLLPTDPDELESVLRASVEPDRRSGTDDDKVFGMARDLLGYHGLVPEELRRAAWTVAGRLPGSTLIEGTDVLGRAGQVLDRSGEDGEFHLVLDPATALLMEESGGVVLESRVADGDELPMEPTLELAGCVDWSTC